MALYIFPTNPNNISSAQYLLYVETCFLAFANEISTWLLESKIEMQPLDPPGC
jgi:hypothetical protein